MANLLENNKKMKQKTYQGSFKEKSLENLRKNIIMEHTFDNYLNYPNLFGPNLTKFHLIYPDLI